MAEGVNRVTIIGNLGDDPELRYTGSGTAVANMSVAVNESYTDENGERQQKTEWIDVVAWGRLGEVCNEYLSRGSQVFFEGKLQTRSWEDNDGNTRYSTEVKARNMQFLDSNRQGDGQGGSPPQGQKSKQQTQQSGSQGSQQQDAGGGGTGFEPDDDLPFAPNKF